MQRNTKTEEVAVKNIINEAHVVLGTTVGVRRVLQTKMAHLI